MGRRKKKQRVQYVTAAKKKQLNQESVDVYTRYIRGMLMRSEKISKTTYRTYKSYFYIFLCFLLDYYDNVYILDEYWIEENMVQVMDHYAEFLKVELKNSANTVNTKISAVSSFYHWAVKRKEIAKHPFSGELKRPKIHQDSYKDYNILTPEEVETIKNELALCNTPLSVYNKLDQVIFHVAYDSACRAESLSQLTVQSLNMNAMKFKNIASIRGRIIDVPFSEETRDIIEEFLEMRNLLEVDCNSMFYVRSGGSWKEMSKQSMYARIRKIGEIVGCDHLRPQDIRETRIEHIKNEKESLARTLMKETSNTTDKE